MYSYWLGAGIIFMFAALTIYVISHYIIILQTHAQDIILGALLAANGFISLFIGAYLFKRRDYQGRL